MNRYNYLKVGLISLGCAKNLVDSEMILSLFKDNNFEIVTDQDEADIIVINTCGFIESSKKESIDTILEMINPNKLLIATGCLVERYKEDLIKEIPEVDLFISIKDYLHMSELIENKLKEKYGEAKFNGYLDLDKRIIATDNFSAYLKISDGCNNRCAFCAIPLIRGDFHSIPRDKVLSQAKELIKKGVKEIVVISQDTTKYGLDFKDGTSIVTLLKDLLEFKEIESIRLLYLYPREVNLELINLIKDNPRISPYFDLPIQHSEDHVLRLMRRKDTKETTIEVINNIRKLIPHAIIRTTLIVGFPGETEEDFNNLVDFIKEYKFDHLGCFTYSREEGTPAYDLDDQVEEKIKKQRYRKIMSTQKAISLKKNKERIGQIHTGYVLDYDIKEDVYTLRSDFNAPDGIDGNIYFKSDRDLANGDRVRVIINDCDHYNLYGEIYE